MSAPFSIRLATPEDTPAIARLGDAVNALHYVRHPDILAAPGDEPARRAFWGERMAQGERFWVADAAGTVVGFVGAGVADEAGSALVQPARPCRVGTLGVNESWRRRGIGRALMRAALAYAQEESATDVRLNVFLFNSEAIAFYERLGFVARNTVMTCSVGATPPA